jgi:hypothetical protein
MRPWVQFAILQNKTKQKEEEKEEKQTLLC